MAVGTASYEDFVDVVLYMRESLATEIIRREPTADEVLATTAFLSLQSASVEGVCALQAVLTPLMPLRQHFGMDLLAGSWAPPSGGPTVLDELRLICGLCNGPPTAPGGADASPWAVHAAFVGLSPFMGGNGLTGRTLWAWRMLRTGQDPFTLGFLHQFYYQTLGRAR